MSDVVRTKPHHFVDIVTSYGRGQETFKPSPYGHAVHTVAAKVLADRDVMLEMELGADDICAPCKHNIDGLCDDTIDTSFRPDAPSSKREYNLLIDERWCKRLDLSQGERLTARAFCDRLKDRCDNLTEIYCENPPERVAERTETLKAGIAKYLSG